MCHQQNGASYALCLRPDEEEDRVSKEAAAMQEWYKGDRTWKRHAEDYDIGDNPRRERGEYQAAGGKGIQGFKQRWIGNLKYH